LGFGAPQLLPFGCGCAALSNPWIKNETIMYNFPMKTLSATACLLLAFIFALAPAALSIEPTQWQYRQPIEVTQPGPLRISVPLETLGRAQPDLRDLRIIGPDGIELPYAILDVPTERQSYKVSGVVLAPRAFSVTMDGDKTIVLIDSGTSLPIDSIHLDIADKTDYTKPARVEVSDNLKNWMLVAQGVPLFRRANTRDEATPFIQDGIPLGARRERYIRITISNQGRDESPIAIRGALIYTTNEIAARAGIPDEDTPVKISSVKHDTDTTTLTLDLGTKNLTLSQLHFDIADTLFSRLVIVFLYPHSIETNPNTPRPEVERSHSIYCIKDVDGTPMTASTTIEFGGRPISSRMIEVLIINDDNPPLDIRGVSAKRRPVHIAFNPSAPGCYTLLSGNAQAPVPRYDLAAFTQNLGRLPVTQLAASPIEPTPDYCVPKPSGTPLNLTTRALFWVALAFVVILLLIIVAKLLPLPKPKK